MAEEYKYGDPIPKKYRNRLFDWEGGGYSGCIFEFNQGLVNNDGHWIPIYSSGYSGIDLDEWYERKIRNLKADFGYDVRPAKMQFEEVLRKAVEKVFGKKWYEIEGNPSEDERVKALVEKDEKRYNEFVKLHDGYRLERTHRLDAMFMQVVTGEIQRDKFEEIGQIDEEHIKETCRVFCERYSVNVGMMTNCLDKMMEMGYSAWCTCSDCGEQFQLSDYEKFQHLVDEDAYHGDGGIGCIFTRVQCEQCREHTTCPNCGGPNMPTRADEESGHAYDHYTFREQFVAEWMGVCQYCAEGFFCDGSCKHWVDDLDDLESKIDGLYEQRRKYLEIMERQDPERYPALVESMKADVEKSRKDLVNEMRDQMQYDVEHHFRDCSDWSESRL